MKNLILKTISPLIISFIVFCHPIFAETLVANHSFIFNQQYIFAEMTYEVKENPTLENPVVDPNFNVMRKRNSNVLQSLSLVAVIFTIAALIPILFSSVFSKKS